MIETFAKRTLDVKQDVQNVTVGFDGPYEATQSLRGDAWIDIKARVRGKVGESIPARRLQVVPKGYESVSGFIRLTTVVMENGKIYHIYGEPKPIECTKSNRNVVLRLRLRMTASRQTFAVGNSPILHVAEDRQGLGQLDMWYQSSNGIFGDHGDYRDFLVVGTGETFPDGFEHVDTVVMRDGLVFHVFKEF